MTTVAAWLILGCALVGWTRHYVHHRRHSPVWEQDVRRHQIDDIIEHDQVEPW